MYVTGMMGINSYQSLYARQKTPYMNSFNGSPVALTKAESKMVKSYSRLNPQIANLKKLQSQDPARLVENIENLLFDTTPCIGDNNLKITKKYPWSYQSYPDGHMVKYDLARHTPVMLSSTGYCVEFKSPSTLSEQIYDAKSNRLITIKFDTNSFEVTEASAKNEFFH